MTTVSELSAAPAPNRQYLASALIALIAFASMVGWKEVRPMDIREAKGHAFVPETQAASIRAASRMETE
jgi:hypothetical protein